MELFSVLVLAFHAAAPAFMRVHASMHLLHLLQYQWRPGVSLDLDQPCRQPSLLVFK